MTSLKAPDAGEILSRAREIRFTTVVLTVVLWLFWLPGLLAGRAWLTLCFIGVAIRRGWRDGTDWDERQAAKAAEAVRTAVMTRGPDTSKVLNGM